MDEKNVEYTIIKYQSVGEDKPNITTSSSMGEHHKEMLSEQKKNILHVSFV